MTTTPRPDPFPVPGARPDPPAPEGWRRHARATALWSGGVALALLVASALVAASWGDELPDPVASHWSGSGSPDGFSSLGSTIAVGLGIGALCVVVFAAITWFWGRQASTRRIMAAAMIWMAGLISLALVGMLDQQRGLPDAHQAGSVNGVLLMAVLVPLLPAAAAALLVHPDPPLPATGILASDAPRTTLRPDERAAWVGRASGRALPAVVLGTTIVVLAVAVASQLWFLLAVAVVLLVLLLSMASFHVRVSESGLTVRSVFGWPRTAVPADEVERADVVRVRPTRDFGGYGWRLGRQGRTGIVLRSGEALEVTRTGGRRLVVTVDDAADAAALLNTMAERARAAR
ncbi:hypothetical protein GCM10025864_43180 [Luteimicrobium album]|uniref:DUF1648 domain-containing protein n=1 Tax=Luteimicrobium album TaxID=1054550 RepID=A0ABQ6I707_9MICO|nr:DUF1648 domain-containing protein [Luteimicrobium album]GMA26559.1 hypothetical protein GCM10025864_43180 [Luteimicrobium album]